MPGTRSSRPPTCRSWRVAWRGACIRTLRWRPRPKVGREAVGTGPTSRDRRGGGGVLVGCCGIVRYGGIDGERLAGRGPVAGAVSAGAAGVADRGGACGVGGRVPGDSAEPARRAVPPGG